MVGDRFRESAKKKDGDGIFGRDICFGGVVLVLRSSYGGTDTTVGGSSSVMYGPSQEQQHAQQ